MSELKESEEQLFSQNPGEAQANIKSKKAIHYLLLGLILTVIIVAAIIIAIVINSSNSEEAKKEEKKEEDEEEEEEVPKSNSTTRFNNDFKIITYYPNWLGDYSSNLTWSLITHVVYAFGFPSMECDGTIQSLKDFEYVIKPMVKKAKENGVSPMISVGGWSVGGVLGADVFANNTDTETKINSFAESILNETKKYGFEGIDICWEYPTLETKEQFSKLMLKLRDICDKNGLYLSAAVSASQGTGYTNEILKKLDFLNVMAYDAENGPGHSPYQYTVDSLILWRDIMGVPANKLTIGVPFYTRPDEITYKDLIEYDQENCNRDETVYKGKTVYYNGMDTMKKKTKFIIDSEAAGVMIWEASEDTEIKEYSLLWTIYNTVVELVGLANK